VKVLITDINDNAPVFTDVFYSFDVPEDTPVGTTVALIEAVDADEGLNGEVVYSLVSAWGQSIFHLDPQMGTISLLKPVDFEQVLCFLSFIDSIGWYESENERKF
jgi:hypothetical protein